jgi:hypothetical protein
MAVFSFPVFVCVFADVHGIAHLEDASVIQDISLRPWV